MKTDTKDIQKQHLINQIKRFCTFRTQCTFIVPVVGHSSNVVELISISSHLGRNWSSQNKSLTISGVASSKIVLLRYWGGPSYQINNTKISNCNKPKIIHIVITNKTKIYHTFGSLRHAWYLKVGVDRSIICIQGRPPSFSSTSLYKWCKSSIVTPFEASSLESGVLQGQTKSKFSQ